MSSTSLFLTLALLTSAVPAAPRAAERADAQRPLVLIVHGRGFLSRDSSDFRRQALRALREGAFRATGDSLLQNDDVRLVWYADLMDVRRSALGGSTLCATNAENADEGISPSFIFRSLALVASELVGGNATDSVADDARDIAGDLRFIGDPALRCAAEGRLAAALARARAEGRPVVVVAHSLGALVAWSHLQHRGAREADDVPEVQRLVTVGSPIGNAELRELLLGDTAPVSLPRGVRSWVNAVNADDPFAARLTPLDSVSGRTRGLRGITDVLTGHSDERAHDLYGYLRDPGTARAVAGAWCEVAPTRSRLAGCRALSEK
jgi:pimeloyl-ACP methyl ester carboxylesterase